MKERKPRGPDFIFSRDLLEAAEKMGKSSRGKTFGDTIASAMRSPFGRTAIRKIQYQAAPKWKPKSSPEGDPDDGT